jgi:hypothetical protein
MKTLILFSLLLLTACTPDYLMMPSNPSEFELSQSQVNTLLYNENGQLLLDFIPALQPFVNEGCNTAWDNLSAIVNPDGSLVYFTNLPAYTESPTDLDKSRFTFIYQAQNPWFGVFPEEEPYAQIAGAGWYTLPIDDYGNMTCQGLQEIRIWVLDEVTNQWYMNSQVCWAALLCNGQSDCDQGWSFDQIEFTSYQSGYVHLSNVPINNN